LSKGTDLYSHLGISRFPFIVTKVKPGNIYGDTKDVNEITGKFQLWRID